MTRKETGQDDIAQKLEELRLARLDANDNKVLAEQLRDELVPMIEDLGSFYFLDSDGTKRYAYYSDSNIEIVDLDALQEAIDAGLVKESVLDEIAPRKVDLDAWRRALKAGRVPPSVARDVGKIVKGRKTIRFSDPEGD